MRDIATTAAITGEMIRDLMTESVDHRFGAEALRTTHAVDCLSDIGPPYTALETRNLGERLSVLVTTCAPQEPVSTAR
jgi:hypothetical protein